VDRFTEQVSLSALVLAPCGPASARARSNRAARSTDCTQDVEPPAADASGPAPSV